MSEGTLFLAQRLPPARTAQLVSQLTGDRLRIAALGDGWSVSLPTGGMTAVTSFEELVRLSRPYVRNEQSDILRRQLAQQPDDGIAHILDALTSSSLAD